GSMDLLAAWLLYPLALGAICVGLGLLVERLAAWRMPGALIVPVGFAALVALARLITFKPETARLALALIGVLAIAGLVAGREQLRARSPDPLLALAALGIFVIFGAPIFLSGTPTFAGYLALPDTSHQLALADMFAHHGPDYAALPKGSGRQAMLAYVQSSYPVGGQVALGVTAPLGVLDAAWLYQPFLTCIAVVLFLALASITAPLFAHRWQAAVTAFVAAQSALVVGFAGQGSIKELAAGAMLVTAAAVLAAAFRARAPARSLLVLAVAAAAALAALGPAALAYLAVAGLLVAVVYGARIVRERRHSELLWLVLGAALAALLSIPVLDTLHTAYSTNSAVLSDQAQGGDSFTLGHLAAPLKLEQALGVWLSGDYRYPARYESINIGLLVLAAAAAALGAVWAVRRREWGPLVLAAVVGPISIYLLGRGNPYADSKVLMLASPALLLLAMVGAASLWTGRWRALSLLAMAALAGGALGSNALAYHDISLAPQDRYAELLTLNERLAGKGPVVFTEYDEFGKYFLRDVPSYNEPEYFHGYVAGFSFADTKRKPSLKTPLDPDDLALAYLHSVPYVIVRRSPISSRPPSNFRRVWRGRYYDLWQRQGRPRVIRHNALGPDVLHPAQRVSRTTARAWGVRARRLHAQIAVAPRQRVSRILPFDVDKPVLWNPFPLYPGALVTSGPADFDVAIRVPRSGRYRVWIEGSFARRLSLRIDDRFVGNTRASLENPGAYQRIGTVWLKRGRHRLRISQGGGDLWPGSGGYRSSLRHIGPIILNPVADEQYPVTYLRAREWRGLIGMNADWLEIVRP
ncbi:MAG: DUF3488 domain-containing protein, partial [Actinomycetota bacterium]|nr:DUF3488 domain-containing protein [Actinomycetota bacterium]